MIDINPKLIPGRYSKWSSRDRKGTSHGTIKGAYQKGYRAGRRYEKEQHQFRTDHLPAPFAFLRKGRWFPWAGHSKSAAPVDGILFKDGTAWDTERGWRPFTFAYLRMEEINHAWTHRTPEELNAETATPAEGYKGYVSTE